MHGGRLFIINLKNTENWKRFDACKRGWKLRVMLPFIFIAILFYSTTTASNILKYIEIPENRHGLKDKKV